MKRFAIGFALLFGLGGLAHGAGLTGYACNGWGFTWLTGPSICGTAPPPASCSNSLDFSDACNSQYVTVIHF